MTKDKKNVGDTVREGVKIVRRWYPRGNIIETSDDLLPEVEGDTFDTIRNKIKKAGKKPAKKMRR